MDVKRKRMHIPYGKDVLSLEGDPKGPCLPEYRRIRLLLLFWGQDHEGSFPLET